MERIKPVRSTKDYKAALKQHRCMSQDRPWSLTPCHGRFIPGEQSNDGVT